MSYCRDVRYGFTTYYFCDWNNQYYISHLSCYNNCLNINGQPFPFAREDFLLVLAFAGVLIGWLLGKFIEGATR